MTRVTKADREELFARHQRTLHEFAAFRDTCPAEGGGPFGHHTAYPATLSESRLLFCFQPSIVHSLAFPNTGNVSSAGQGSPSGMLSVD